MVRKWVGDLAYVALYENMSRIIYGMHRCKNVHIKIKNVKNVKSDKK